MTMSSPGKYDLDLYRGDSSEWTFKLWNRDSQGVQTEVDLTGATVAAEIRDKPGGQTVITLNCVVALPNTIYVKLTPAMWSVNLKGGAWDLEVTNASGVHTYIAGRVTVTPDVTNLSTV
jgi:hypothetical protein